jgi:hypothetical protein
METAPVTVVCRFDSSPATAETGETSTDPANLMAGFAEGAGLAWQVIVNMAKAGATIKIR